MIGIISDTHDNLDAIRRAVEFFNSRGVSLVLHAGDFIAPFVAREFGKLDSDLIGVFGNNDGERKGLNEKFSGIGIRTELMDFAEIKYKSKRICIYHGTFEEIVNALVKSKEYDVVVRGHTHKPEIKRENGVLIINPGEACGYLTGKQTVALLNVDGMMSNVDDMSHVDDMPDVNSIPNVEGPHSGKTRELNAEIFDI